MICWINHDDGLSGLVVVVVVVVVEKLGFELREWKGSTGVGRPGTVVERATSETR